MLFDLDRPWWDFPLAIVDFETTGPDPLECAPVSFACIRLQRGQECGGFQTLLNPRCPIPEGATAIHGITDADVEHAPDLADVARELIAVCEGALPVAYNAPFDRELFIRFGPLDGRCALFDPAQKWLDPLVMIRKLDHYVAGSGRHKLERTCERWGVPFCAPASSHYYYQASSGAHDALADVRAVGRLLDRLVWLGKLNPRTPLGRLLAYIDQQRQLQDKDRAEYLARKQDERQQAGQGDLFAPKEEGQNHGHSTH